MSIGTIAAALLLPKCPMCIAVALSAIGLGGSFGAAVAPLLRPVAIALGGLALLTLAWAEVRRRRARASGDCCAARAGRARQ